VILVVFTFLVSVGWLAACSAGAILGMLWHARGNGHALHPWALNAPRIAFAIPLFGSLTALASLLPARAWTWLQGLCACEAYGGVHVCPFHFRDAAFLLLLSLPVGLFLFLRRLRGVAAVVQRSRDLEHLASVEQPRADGLVPFDHGGRPVVFVAGLWRPCIMGDAVWWDSLSPRERGVVNAHEKAHVEARDPLVMAGLELMLRLVAPRTSARIIRDWTLAAEVRADAAAAEQDGDPIYVAEVLCRHARAAAPRGALGIGGTDLDARVRSLLEGRSPARVSLRWSLCFAGFVAAGLSGHVAHRAFEALLALLQ
jgi:hypothetical protein